MALTEMQQSKGVYRRALWRFCLWAFPQHRKTTSLPFPLQTDGRICYTNTVQDTSLVLLLLYNYYLCYLGVLATLGKTVSVQRDCWIVVE